MKNFVAKNGIHPETGQENTSWVELNGKPTRMSTGGIIQYRDLDEAQFAARCSQRRIDSGEKTVDQYFAVIADGSLIS